MTEITIELKAEFNDLQGAVRELGCHQSGRFFFARSDEMLILFDLINGKKLKGFYSSSGYDAAAFSHDGFSLSYMTEDQIHVWDLYYWRETQVYPGTLSEAKRTDASLDLGLWALGNEQGIIEVRKIEKDEEDAPDFQLSGHENYIDSVRFHPSGKILATGSADMTFRFWDLEERKEISHHKVHSDFVTALAFTNDGRMMLSGDYSGKIKLWSINIKF
ncbi:MAG: hypothetical protein ABIC40_06035 [bacterium]